MEMHRTGCLPQTTFISLSLWDDSRDGGGTITWRESVGASRERRPRTKSGTGVEGAGVWAKRCRICPFPNPRSTPDSIQPMLQSKVFQQLVGWTRRWCPRGYRDRAGTASIEKTEHLAFYSLSLRDDSRDGGGRMTSGTVVERAGVRAKRCRDRCGSFLTASYYVLPLPPGEGRGEGE